MLNRKKRKVNLKRCEDKQERTLAFLTSSDSDWQTSDGTGDREWEKKRSWGSGGDGGKMKNRKLRTGSHF